MGNIWDLLQNVNDELKKHFLCVPPYRCVNGVYLGEVQEAIDKATLITNREFKRKLQEFGYVDEEGNLIAEYPINSIERLKEKLGESEE